MKYSHGNRIESKNKLYIHEKRKTLMNIFTQCNDKNCVSYALRETWDKLLFIKWNNSFKIGWSIHSLVYRCLSTWRAPVVSYCALLASEHASFAAWSFAENTKHTNTLTPSKFKSNQVNSKVKVVTANWGDLVLW